MGLMLVMTWAMGFFMGWVTKDLVQMKAPAAATALQGATEGPWPWPPAAVAAAPAARATKTTRTMAAQSPTTYAWHRAEPRFLGKAGAWLED